MWPFCCLSTTIALIGLSQVTLLPTYLTESVIGTGSPFASLVAGSHDPEIFLRVQLSGPELLVATQNRDFARHLGPACLDTFEAKCVVGGSQKQLRRGKRLQACESFTGLGFRCLLV